MKISRAYNIVEPTESDRQIFTDNEEDRESKRKVLFYLAQHHAQGGVVVINSSSRHLLEGSVVCLVGVQAKRGASTHALYGFSENIQPNLQSNHSEQNFRTSSEPTETSDESV